MHLYLIMMIIRQRGGKSFNSAVVGGDKFGLRGGICWMDPLQKFGLLVRERFVVMDGKRKWGNRKSLQGEKDEAD